MSQLIKITTTPIKMSFKLQRGQFEEAEPTKQYVEQNYKIPAIETSSPRVSTYQPRHYAVNTDKVSVNSQTINASIPIEFATIDNVLNMRVSDRQKESSIPQAESVSANSVVRERITDQHSQNVAYVSSNSEQVKWQPSMLDLQINMDYDDGVDLRYVPGKVIFEIEEYPSVKIEYLGGPMYVPPSSDPNFIKK